MDRSSARILYHPPAKRSPVPTRLTPRQLPGHSSTSFNSPHIAKAPRTPPRLSCPRGKTGLAGGPAGWLTEQRADEDDNLHGGCELAVQLRLAQLPERAEVGASLGTRRVARVAGVRRHPAVVVPHSEAGGLRSPARPRSPAHSRSWPGRGGSDARVPSSVLQSRAGGWPLTSAHSLASSPRAGVGGRRGRAPCLLPPWARQQPHGGGTVTAHPSLGPPPESGGAPRPSPPCRDIIGGCGGPTHALLPSPYRGRAHLAESIIPMLLASRLGWCEPQEMPQPSDRSWEGEG